MGSKSQIFDPSIRLSRRGSRVKKCYDFDDKLQFRVIFDILIVQKAHQIYHLWVFSVSQICSEIVLSRGKSGEFDSFRSQFPQLHPKTTAVVNGVQYRQLCSKTTATGATLSIRRTIQKRITLVRGISPDSSQCHDRFRGNQGKHRSSRVP